jgi:hypothetical protein
MSTIIMWEIDVNQSVVVSSSLIKLNIDSAQIQLPNSLLLFLFGGKLLVPSSIINLLFRCYTTSFLLFLLIFIRWMTCHLRFLPFCCLPFFLMVVPFFLSLQKRPRVCHSSYFCKCYQFMQIDLMQVNVAFLHFKCIRFFTSKFFSHLDFHQITARDTPLQGCHCANNRCE